MECVAYAAVLRVHCSLDDLQAQGVEGARQRCEQPRPAVCLQRQHRAAGIGVVVHAHGHAAWWRLRLDPLRRLCNRMHCNAAPAATMSAVAHIVWPPQPLSVPGVNRNACFVAAFAAGYTTERQQVQLVGKSLC